MRHRGSRSVQRPKIGPGYLPQGSQAIGRCVWYTTMQRMMLDGPRGTEKASMPPGVRVNVPRYGPVEPHRQRSPYRQHQCAIVALPLARPRSHTILD